MTLLPLALFPPAVLRPRGKISIWLLTYKMSGCLRPPRALQLRSVVARDWPMGKLVVVYTVFITPSPLPRYIAPHVTLLASMLPSILSIAHFAAGRLAKQRSSSRGNCAPLLFSSPLLLIDPARSLARPSRWCHFLPRWNASCSGRRTGRRSSERPNESKWLFLSLPSLTRFSWSLAQLDRPSLPSSFNNAFLSLVMHLVRRSLADRPTQRSTEDHDGRREIFCFGRRRR